MNEVLETGRVEVPGRAMTPPAPGQETIGPALVDLVAELRQVVSLERVLAARAARDAIEDIYTGMVQGATDANGDAALKLFEVPQGAKGYLTLATVDMAGVTPASPDTNANLWHGIYGSSAADPTAAQADQVGGLLDAMPNSPSVDAMIPFNYAYGNRETAPCIMGPQAFYFVIDAATATRQIAVRFNVVVCRYPS